MSDDIKALATHIAATAEWVNAEHPASPESEDADWLRGFMTVDPRGGRWVWTAWGYGSPCPEGKTSTREDARAAACHAMAESFIKAAAEHGLTVAVAREGGGVEG